MNGRSFIGMLAVLWAAPSLAQEDVLWRCSDPSVPFRYVDSEEQKAAPPPCREWVQLRGKNLKSILSALGSDQFASANVFLAEASAFAAFDYPGADSMPVSTHALYADPESFGFKVVSIDQAPTGSLVVYNGLGGILVEMREPESGEWKRQVLYPSASARFWLNVTDLHIAGKLEPRVLVSEELTME